MPSSIAAAALTLALVGAVGAVGAVADVKPHAGMMRFPDISADQIVFSYANDLWTAPRDGGVATPLASPPGPEAWPHFSADGKTIAFIGNYDGNRDIYTIAADGGVPYRVTGHPASEILCDWTPDGRLLFISNGLGGLPRQSQLFTTGASGGLPTKMPVPYGGFGAISPDGTWLAYTPHTTDFRTWKRYRGGMATDIWLFNLKDNTAKQMTTWEGTDTAPMWHKDKVYYLTDEGPEHRLNIWMYDPATGNREQITKFTDYDIKWPSVGPGKNGQGEIIFQYESELYVLDLGTKTAKPVEIAIPGERPQIRPRSFDTRGQISSGDVSPAGKRAVIEARGDLWSAPAQKGTPRNLTRSSGTAERSPAWSPDGKWIAYLADTTGEYELYIMPADGGEAKRLTTDGGAFRYNPTWSPDSKRIAFTDKSGAMYLHTIDGGVTKKFDTPIYAQPGSFNWAADSNWIVYSKTLDNQLSALFVYNVADDKVHQLTSGRFNDGSPTFDRKGEYIYFTSNRDFGSAIYDDYGANWAYANTPVLLAVPLRNDIASPYAAKSDEEELKKDEKKDAASQPATSSAPASASAPATSTAPATSSAPATASAPAEEKKDEVKPVKIDLDGFERRAIQLAPRGGYFGNLAVNHEGKLLFVRFPGRGSSGEPAIKLFDIADEKKEEKQVVAGAGNFAISADGKKLLVPAGGNWVIIDAAPDQKLDKPIPLDNLATTIDPRAEWQQLFNDAWRIERDYFYDPNMHGVDWKAVKARYQKMLDDCTSREDVGYVIAEMISELNVGHAYYGGGDVEGQPSVSVGMLGCDFELDPTGPAYKVKRIVEGAPWDSDARGPLSQAGVNIKPGEYLLAVNGIPIDTNRDPWFAFQGLAGKTVVLTVSDKAKIDDTARKVPIELIGGEGNLRYRDWIEGKRAAVDKASGGKIGYIYVPNTGLDGQTDLVRQFYSQIDKPALIIDERWNGGGQIPTRFIELLNRPRTNYWAVRDGKDWAWPPDSHQGPKCMLINGLAGSGGDMFPWLFKQSKLGPVIGRRTWGGLVGISGNPGLIDGGNVTAPTFAFYEKDGTWGVEGHGVDPDVEVIDDPSKMVDGGDPQLDVAIKMMLDEIAKNPYAPPKRPAYPDRKGMGIRPEDR